MVLIRAPAKLNLGLWICDRRADGYHEIVTVFVPLRLFDRLELEVTHSGVTLSCDPELPSGDGNLALRAARRAAEALGFSAGIAIRLEKKIPVAAGLGGGSSDAAAAILGLEMLAEAEIPSPQREALARELGADVSFFLDPRPALGRGIGERLEPLGGFREGWWVLALMPFGVSTTWAYGAAARELTLPQDPPSIAALRGPGAAVASTHNDLEAVTARRHPEVREARRALERVGARVVGMSGSGPTVYGQFADREVAEAAAKRARLPAGARALVVSSPGSDSLDWGWGVAKR